jgi:hypothetical protein
VPELVFNSGADVHGVVHVRSLLEFSGTHEALLAVAGLWIVLGSRNPADVVFFVVIAARSCFVFRDELHAIVVDEDIGSAALHFVGGDGVANRDHRRVDDGFKAFLVYWALNRDVR